MSGTVVDIEMDREEARKAIGESTDLKKKYSLKGGSFPPGLAWMSVYPFSLKIVFFAILAFQTLSKDYIDCKPTDAASDADYLNGKCRKTSFVLRDENATKNMDFVPGMSLSQIQWVSPRSKQLNVPDPSSVLWASFFGGILFLLPIILYCTTLELKLCELAILVGNVPGVPEDKRSRVIEGIAADLCILLQRSYGFLVQYNWCKYTVLFIIPFHNIIMNYLLHNAWGGLFVVDGGTISTMAPLPGLAMCTTYRMIANGIIFPTDLQVPIKCEFPINGILSEYLAIDRILTTGILVVAILFLAVDICLLIASLFITSGDAQPSAKEELVTEYAKFCATHSSADAFLLGRFGVYLNKDVFNDIVKEVNKIEAGVARGERHVGMIL